MAGQLSVWSANRVLNKLLRGEDYSVTPSYWIAAFKATDAAALRANTPGAASEVSAVGYARIEIRGGTALNFTASTAAFTQVSGLLAWAPAVDAWGTVTFAAVMDSATIGAGNVVVLGALASPKVVDAGDTLKIPSGLFTVGL